MIPHVTQEQQTYCVKYSWIVNLSEAQDYRYPIHPRGIGY